MDFLRHLLACLTVILPITAATAAPTVKTGKIDAALVQQVFEEICRLQIRQPQMVMRQAILETGWLRARFLMDRQNLFGFRTSKYLTFDHWKDSVAYYKVWQERKYPADGQEEYGAFLKRIKYASAGYVAHLHKIQWEQACPEPTSSAAEPSQSAPSDLTPERPD